MGWWWSVLSDAVDLLLLLLLLQMLLNSRPCRSFFLRRRAHRYVRYIYIYMYPAGIGQSRVE